MPFKTGRAKIVAERIREFKRFDGVENSIGNLSAFSHTYNTYCSLRAKVGKPDVMILAGLQNQITNYRYEKNAKRNENVSQRSDSQ